MMLAVLLGTASAQDSRPAAPPELRMAVEAYLGEREEAAAARLLEALVRRPDATPDNVRAALIASDAPLAHEMNLLVPHKDQLLAATIEMPEGHGHTGPRLPVVFDIAKGDMASWLNFSGAVVVFVKGYTPPEFSDEGRDGFLKVLRRAAHLAHGDPDRLWLCGFSWAAHASWDVSLHRPGVIRGIATGGGGPRRTWFRLLTQLAPEKVLSFCGQKDDPELLWNLREVEHLAPRLKLDYALVLDPERGHEMPLQGTEKVAGIVRDTAALDSPLAVSGTLLADGAQVESPLLRLDDVDERRVAVRQAIPVDGSLSADGQRRATIDAMAAKVAKLTWRIEEKKGETLVTLSADGVTAATLFLREPAFHPGRKVTVRAGTKAAFSDVLTADPKTMLAEARRTGERQRPALRTVEVRFQAGR